MAQFYTEKFKELCKKELIVIKIAHATGLIVSIKPRKILAE